MQKNRVLVIVFALLLAGMLLPRMFLSKHPAAVVGPAVAKLSADTSFLAAVTIGMVAPASALGAAGIDAAEVPAIPVIFVGEGGMNFPKDKPPSGRGTFVLGGTDEKRLTVDVVTAQNGNAYARLTNLDSAEGEGTDAIKAVEGQWFSMSSRTLAAMLAGDAASAASPVDPNAAPGTRPAATWQSLRNQIADGDLFGVPVQLGVAGLDSVFVRHYALPVRPDQLGMLAQDIKSLELGRALTASEQVQVVQKAANTSVQLEVWVDVRTEELQQAKLTIGTLDPGTKAEDLREFSALVKFTSWGAPVEVVPPAQSRDFNELTRLPQP